MRRSRNEEDAYAHQGVRLRVVSGHKDSRVALQRLFVTSYVKGPSLCIANRHVIRASLYKGNDSNLLDAYRICFDGKPTPPRSTSAGDG
jgi:hypothetical protein